MDEILPALQTMMIDYIATHEPLSVDALTGSSSLTVANTSRFRVNDEIFIMSTPLGLAESSKIVAIPDYQTLTLNTPTLRDWLVSDTTMIQKAVNYQMLSAVYIGDLPSMPKFPCITISPMSESNEWMTLRATSHEYKFQFRAYVLTDNYETTNLYLPKLAKQIREVLIDHVHPIVKGEEYPLTADLLAGSTVVNVANTSGLIIDRPTFIRDNKPRPSSEENDIMTILSPTALKLRAPTKYDYLVSREATLFKINRFLYDTRPDNINMGFSPQKGGQPLKVATIDYFAKEYICREGTVIV